MPTVDLTRIAGNIGALYALNSLRYINSQLSVHQARLATGKRILEAADDPVGMSLATTFDIRRKGLETALRTIGDSKNLLSTMEGGLTRIKEILVTLRNKALEAQGDTIGENERSAIQTQMRSFRDEINDIVNQTQWNNTYLLGDYTSGSANNSNPYNFLVDSGGGMSLFAFEGTGSASATRVTSQASGGVNINTSATIGYGTAASAGEIQTLQSFASQVNGTAGSYAGETGITGLGLHNENLTVIGSGSAGVTSRAIAFSAIDYALNIVKQGVAQVGAFTARLTFKEDAITVQHLNTEATYNRIMNANMAREQVEASKYMILQQTAVAMLAQANAGPQFILSLFQ